MIIKNAHIAINVRTKKELNKLPTFTECELRVSIGQYGFAKIDIIQKSGKAAQQGEFGQIATVTIVDPCDMERIAKSLLALANATREVGE